MSSPVKTIAILVARPGRIKELKALLESMVVPSRAEPGNLRYELWQNQADANSLALDELYTDRAAVAAHRATRHFESYLSKINGLADRTVVVLEPLNVSGARVKDEID